MKKLVKVLAPIILVLASSSAFAWGHGGGHWGHGGL